MNTYIVKMFTNIRDHYDGQLEHMSTLYRLGIHKIKWLSGQSIPKNWTGYDEHNPSPGKDIYSHTWEIRCNKEELTALKLAIDLQILEQSKENDE